MLKHIFRWFGPLALLFILISCGTDHSMMDDDTMDGMDHSTMPMNGMTDLAFIDGMIMHHQGAVAMAEQALQESSRPEVTELAQQIIAAQQPEIEQLQAWRDLWFPNEPATSEQMLQTMNMGDMMLAPGDAATIDMRFLTAMISHHQGAIQMAEMIKTSTERPELQTFADTVIRDQMREIEQMQTWLDEWK